MGDNMKKKICNTIIIFMLLVFLSITYLYRSSISTYIVKNYMLNTNINMSESSTYTKNIDYKGFKNTTNFIPSNKQELINDIYTILNRGWDEYSFYCADSYDCSSDIKTMTNDGTFAIINNYVHPYNSYKTLNISIDNYGVITINVIKNYTDDEIKTINSKINDIIYNNINSTMSTKEKIETFHDYIVDHTVYDTEEAKLVEQNTSSNLASYKAYNVVVNGIGLCGGYSDTLAIFLNKIGVNNFKVSTDKHVWNVIYFEDNWYHIDMTWDDPVTTSNTPKLIHDYFIISTNQLHNLDNQKHNFNANNYLELN